MLGPVSNFFRRKTLVSRNLNPHLCAPIIAAWTLISERSISPHRPPDDQERNADQRKRGKDAKRDEGERHDTGLPRYGHERTTLRTSARRQSINACLRYDEPGKRRLRDWHPGLAAGRRNGIRDLDRLPGYHAPHFLVRKWSSRLPPSIGDEPRRGRRCLDIDGLLADGRRHREGRLIATHDTESRIFGYVCATTSTKTHFSPR
jgi:hypothetical protein